MIRNIFFLGFLFFVCIAKSWAQCSNNGQNPTSAFPVCAATTFTQSTVPACTGQNLPVPPCTGTIYTDINPYYYKFTAFQTTVLQFTIQPLNSSDDYDWQLFDVTGKNPNNIYTDASMYVCCNWSGNSGNTGTSLAATNTFSCEGNTSNFTKAPTLIQGHNYLLMVSHFTTSNQSGYNLNFTNASGMVDTTSPSVKNITANCVANQVLIKLNKKMKCNSIASDASDVIISTNPAIASITGYGCSGSFDTDSIIVSLLNPLPAGTYSAQIKTGTDGNTILDNCGNGIPDNQTFNFDVVGASQPTLIDSVQINGCNPQSIKVIFKSPIRCNTVASNGSDFSIAGPGTTTITGAVANNCNSNNLSNTVTLNFATPISATGTYTVSIKLGTDGNTILNQCDVATPVNNNVIFTAYNKPTAAFNYTIVNETCKADTINYTHNANNGVNKWLWSFDGNPGSSTNQNQQVVYNSFTTRVVKLKVSNPQCSDSVTQNITIADHLLIPKINSSRDTTCPNNPETFTDASSGNIQSWSWDFANGQTSTSSTPPQQLYPVLPVNKIYPTKLIVSNLIGCKDSVIKNIFVRGTIPAVFDSVIPPTCAANEVKIYFKQDMQCGSVAADGSDFSISGVAPNSITGAAINCANGVGTVITLQLANPLVTGNYSLTLKQGTDGNTIINDCGIGTIASTVTFKAFGHVNPSFNYVAKWGCVKDTISFIHISNNAVNNWQWNFNDGSPSISSSNIQNPIVVYSDVTSNHSVQLIASNGICNDTSNQTINIIDHSIAAKFGVVDTTCGLGNTIFTDSSKGIITKWNWSFGAGLTSNLSNPAPVNYPLLYVYATYQARLVITNIVGCVDSSTIKNVVIKPASPALMDKIDYKICSPDSFIIHFNSPMLCNSVAADGSDFILSGPGLATVTSAYISDCINNKGRTVVVKLNAPISFAGNYKISIVKGTDGNTVINDCGIASNADFIGFVVNLSVNANFDTAIKSSCKSDTLFLSHNGANGINKWRWFVNGVLMNQSSNFSMAYSDSSVKSILLIVNNPTCADTSSLTIPLVFNKIQAKFDVDRDIICPTETVKFIDLSSGNITSWKWNFGNNATSNLPIPADQNYNLPADKINPSTGSTMLTGDNFYTTAANLVITNSKGCTSKFEKLLKITSNCLIQVPSAFSPNGDGLNDFLYPLNTYKASKFNFRVYNRAGILIFESSTASSKWNGSNYQRIKQPPGTYVWTLNYTDMDSGKDIFLKGTVVLIR